MLVSSFFIKNTNNTRRDRNEEFQKEEVKGLSFQNFQTLKEIRNTRHFWKTVFQTHALRGTHI